MTDTPAHTPLPEPVAWAVKPLEWREVQGAREVWWSASDPLGGLPYEASTLQDRAAVDAKHEARIRSALEPVKVSPDIRATLHLIRVFAEDTTESNWADKRLYIKQQAERGIAEIDALPPTPEAPDNE